MLKITETTMVRFGVATLTACRSWRLNCKYDLQIWIHFGQMVPCFVDIWSKFTNISSLRQSGQGSYYIIVFKPIHHAEIRQNC